MSVVTANGIEDYRDEILNRLLDLRRENPWWWLKMAVQVNETSDAEGLSEGSIVHWLDQGSIHAGQWN